MAAVSDPLVVTNEAPIIVFPPLRSIAMYLRIGTCSFLQFLPRFRTRSERLTRWHCSSSYPLSKGSPQKLRTAIAVLLLNGRSNLGTRLGASLCAPRDDAHRLEVGWFSESLFRALCTNEVMIKFGFICSESVRVFDGLTVDDPEKDKFSRTFVGCGFCCFGNVIASTSINGKWFETVYISFITRTLGT